MVERYSFKKEARTDEEQAAPKREPDVPTMETHISAVVARKDGKLWIKHQTVITDWKPVTYYEKVVMTAQRKASEASERE